MKRKFIAKRMCTPPLKNDIKLLSQIKEMDPILKSRNISKLISTSMEVLTEEEKKILWTVINRDEALKMKEDRHLNRIWIELQYLRKRSALKASSDTPKRYCARCRVELGLVFNRGDLCKSCGLLICKSCRDSSLNESWLCTLCQKKRELHLASGNWMNSFVRRASRRRSSQYLAPTFALKNTIRRSWGGYEVPSPMLTPNYRPLSLDEFQKLAINLRSKNSLNSSRSNFDYYCDATAYSLTDADGSSTCTSRSNSPQTSAIPENKTPITRSDEEMLSGKQRRILPNLPMDQLSIGGLSRENSLIADDNTTRRSATDSGIYDVLQEPDANNGESTSECQSKQSQDIYRMDCRTEAKFTFVGKNDFVCGENKPVMSESTQTSERSQRTASSKKRDISQCHVSPCSLRRNDNVTQVSIVNGNSPAIRLSAKRADVEPHSTLLSRSKSFNDDFLHRNNYNPKHANVPNDSACRGAGKSECNDARKNALLVRHSDRSTPEPVRAGGAFRSVSCHSSSLPSRGKMRSSGIVSQHVRFFESEFGTKNVRNVTSRARESRFEQADVFRQSNVQRGTNIAAPPQWSDVSPTVAFPKVVSHEKEKFVPADKVRLSPMGASSESDSDSFVIDTFDCYSSSVARIVEGAELSEVGKEFPDQINLQWCESCKLKQSSHSHSESTDGNFGYASKNPFISDSSPKRAQFHVSTGNESGRSEFLFPNENATVGKNAPLFGLPKENSEMHSDSYVTPKTEVDCSNSSNSAVCLTLNADCILNNTQESTSANCLKTLTHSSSENQFFLQHAKELRRDNSETVLKWSNDIQSLQGSSITEASIPVINEKSNTNCNDELNFTDNFKLNDPKSPGSQDRAIISCTDCDTNLNDLLKTQIPRNFSAIGNARYSKVDNITLVTISAEGDKVISDGITVINISCDEKFEQNMQNPSLEDIPSNTKEQVNTIKLEDLAKREVETRVESMPEIRIEANVPMSRMSEDGLGNAMKFKDECVALLFHDENEISDFDDDATRMEESIETSDDATAHSVTDEDDIEDIDDFDDDGEFSNSENMRFGKELSVELGRITKFTLHTIVEESDEESCDEGKKKCARNDEKKPSQLERYFFYDLAGKTESDIKKIGNEESECSDTFSETSGSAFSESIDAGESDDVEAAPSMLEQYFLTNFLGIEDSNENYMSLRSGNIINEDLIPDGAKREKLPTPSKHTLSTDCLLNQTDFNFASYAENQNKTVSSVDLSQTKQYQEETSARRDPKFMNQYDSSVALFTKRDSFGDAVQGKESNTTDGKFVGQSDPTKSSAFTAKNSASLLPDVCRFDEASIQTVKDVFMLIKTLAGKHGSNHKNVVEFQKRLTDLIHLTPGVNEEQAKEVVEYLTSSAVSNKSVFCEAGNLSTVGINDASELIPFKGIAYPCTPESASSSNTSDILNPNSEKSRHDRNSSFVSTSLSLLIAKVFLYAGDRINELVHDPPQENNEAGTRRGSRFSDTFEQKNSHQHLRSLNKTYEKNKTNDICSSEFDAAVKLNDPSKTWNEGSPAAAADTNKDVFRAVGKKSFSPMQKILTDSKSNVKNRSPVDSQNDVELTGSNEKTATSYEPSWFAASKTDEKSIILNVPRTNDLENCRRNEGTVKIAFGDFSSALQRIPNSSVLRNKESDVESPNFISNHFLPAAVRSARYRPSQTLSSKFPLSSSHQSYAKECWWDADEASVSSNDPTEYNESSLQTEQMKSQSENQHRSSKCSILSQRSISSSFYYIPEELSQSITSSVTVRGEIQLLVQYNDQNSCIEIHVKQCHNLSSVDTKRNRSDPYVKIYMLPDKSKAGKRKTKVKKHTLNPVYDEVLKFPIKTRDLENHTIWLSVWHSDMFGRNEFLGEVWLPLSEINLQQTESVWYPLQERASLSQNKDVFNKGHVIVALKYTPGSKINSHSHLQQSILYVLVKEARQLTASLDSYCKCRFILSEKRSIKYKSGIVKNNCNPVWNHTFQFKGVKYEELKKQQVELTIWSHNLCLGGIVLGLNSCSVEEVALWQDMLQRSSLWVQACLFLHSLTSTTIIK